jgi:DNA-binding CsgD family transcriptional regulator
MEVALMLIKGERSVDIAKRLSLSEKTVSTHKTRLLEKLNVKDVVGIAHLARLHGVIDANGAS